MNSAKEYLQKIVAWAKEHPWLAAGILGGIVLVIWLAVRNGWFGGGGGGSSGEVYMPEGDGGDSTLPNLTDLPDTSALPEAIGQSTEPIEVSLPLPQSYSGFPSFSDVMDYSSAELPLSDYGAGYAEGAPVASPGTQTLAEVLGPSPSAAIGGGLFSGNLAYDTREELPSKIVSIEPAKTVAKAAAPASTKKQTDSQKVGKGAKFTGYVNGVYYVNGSIATTRAANIPGSSGAVLIGDPAKAPAANKPKGVGQKRR